VDFRKPPLYVDIMNPCFPVRFFSKCGCLIACVALMGCGSQSEAPRPAKTEKPQAKPSQPSAPTFTNGSIVTAPVDYIGATIHAGQKSKGTIELVTFRKAIESFQEEQQRFPQSLDELLEKSYIKVMPTPPYGLQFEYDAASGEIKLVPKQ